MAAAPFYLVSIQFTTMGSLTLTFSDTVSTTAPANIDPSNYLISDDVQVIGNFSISGPNISFDIGYTAIGAIYDITVNNLVSSGNVAVSSPNRLSFFFGIGVITPMLVNSVENFGTLYIISDSALVGQNVPSGVTTNNFGVQVGQSVIQSYNEVISEIPTGGFYNLDTVTIPYVSGNVEFLFITASPGVQYGIYINNVFRGSSTANWQGWVGFQLNLPATLVDIQIIGNNSPTIFYAELVSAKYVTWIGGMCDALGDLDAEVNEVQDAMSLETVTSDDIYNNFGAFVQTEQVSSYTIDVYRAQLVEIFQAFRCYAGTYEGLTNVVAAFTQVRPIAKWFRSNAARWILAWQHLLNREMTERFRYVTSGDPSSDIIATSVSSTNENGTAHIFWTASSHLLQYKSVSDASYGAGVVANVPGTYTLISFNGIDTVTVKVSIPTPGSDTIIPVSITGPVFPNDVIIQNANYRILDGAYMQRNGLHIQLTATANNPAAVLMADPTTFEHLGEYFVASCWVYQTTGSTQDFIVEISEDGGNTWLSGAVAAPVSDSVWTRVSTAQSIGYFGITAISIRVRSTTITSGGSFFLEKACLHSPQTGGLYLTENTRCRSPRRAYFGYELLIFSPETLEVQAFEIMGIQPSLGWGLDPWSTSPWGSPSYGYFGPTLAASGAAIGLINYIVPTISEIDFFQDSVMSPEPDVGIINVVGAVYENDWRSGVATNLTVVPQTPDRFSYVAPSSTSIASEPIIFNGSNIATLSYVSLEEPDQSRLLQDGVPVPNTEWYYADTTHIELTGPADQSSIYTFSYPILISFQTVTIDLGINYNLFNWYADWYEYNRVALDSTAVAVNEAIVFSSVTLLGTTSQIIDTTQPATLYVNNGGTVAPASPTLWAITGPNVVKIDPSIFNPTYTYSFDYTAQSLIKQPIVTTVVQVQYSEDNITFSDWVTIPHDAPFGNRFRYFNMQIFIYGITTLIDYKLRSLVLKGDPLNRNTIQASVT